MAPEPYYYAYQFSSIAVSIGSTFVEQEDRGVDRDRISLVSSLFAYKKPVTTSQHCLTKNDDPLVQQHYLSDHHHFEME
jgi:hypothetical protein